MSFLSDQLPCEKDVILLIMYNKHSNIGEKVLISLVVESLYSLWCKIFTKDLVVSQRRLQTKVEKLIEKFKKEVIKASEYWHKMTKTLNYSVCNGQ